MPQGIHLRNAKCTGRLMMAAEIIHQRKSSTPKEHIFSGAIILVLRDIGNQTGQTRD